VREEFVKEEVAPETEKRTAQFCARFPKKLTEARHGSKRAMPRAMRRTTSASGRAASAESAIFMTQAAL